MSEYTENRGEFLLYKAVDGDVRVDVFFQEETVWLTQKALAGLFGVQRPAITKHLKNIFDTLELAADSVCSKMEHTAEDGKKYRTQYYNLDAIIAVGYRVNSYQATQFRIWATRHLKEFLIKVGQASSLSAVDRLCVGRPDGSLSYFFLRSLRRVA